MSRYQQPLDWPVIADYKGYLEKEVLQNDNINQLERIRKRFQIVDKLGESQSAELLLKLASYIRSEYG